MARCAVHLDTYACPQAAHPHDLSSEAAVLAVCRCMHHSIGVHQVCLVPDYALRMQVLTKRGKNEQKHYTVFICPIACNARDSWEPTLNEEHSAWRWVKADELRQQTDLHPVTEMVLKDHWDTVKPLIGTKD